MQQFFTSNGYFLFFIKTLVTGFARSDKKYAKVIDDDICNRKTGLKAKSDIMKMSRNYKKVDKKIWRVSKCKEIVEFRDFLYKI